MAFTTQKGSESAHVEKAQDLTTLESNDEKDAHDAAGTLSEEHREYLMRRHGTLDLDPMPSMDPADPYNWKLSKVRAHSRTENRMETARGTDRAETHQPPPGCSACIHGHLHGFWRHSGVCFHG